MGVVDSRALGHRPGLAWVDVDGEVVVYDPERRVPHLLSVTGSLLWPHFSHPVTPADLAEDVAEVFEIPVGDATAQVAAFCDQLADLGLLVPAATDGDQPR